MQQECFHFGHSTRSRKWSIVHYPVTNVDFCKTFKFSVILDLLAECHLLKLTKIIKGILCKWPWPSTKALNKLAHSAKTRFTGATIWYDNSTSFKNRFNANFYRFKHQSLFQTSDKLRIYREKRNKAKIVKQSSSHATFLHTKRKACTNASPRCTIQQIYVAAFKGKHRAPLYTEAENLIMCCSSKALLSSKTSMHSFYGFNSMKSGLLKIGWSCIFGRSKSCSASKKWCVRMTKTNERCNRGCMSIWSSFSVRGQSKLVRIPVHFNQSVYTKTGRSTFALFHEWRSWLKFSVRFARGQLWPHQAKSIAT